MRFQSKVKFAAAVMLAAVMVFLSACSGANDSGEKKGRSSDTGIMPNSGYAAAAQKALDMIDTVKDKVNSSVDKNNKAVERRAGEKYFLEPDYLSIAFLPFQSDYLGYTLSFADYKSESDVLAACSKLAQGENSLKYSVSQNTCTLTVTGIGNEYELRCESSDGGERIRFTRNVFYDTGDITEEFFECVDSRDLGYLIQSDNIRCTVSLDDDGEISSFCCAQLINGEYSAAKDSVYEGDEISSSAYEWVTARGKNAYSFVFSYDGGILKCEENSGGEWKTVSIE